MSLIVPPTRAELENKKRKIAVLSEAEQVKEEIIHAEEEYREGLT